jgi:hypothetical protein
MLASRGHSGVNVALGLLGMGYFERVWALWFLTHMETWITQQALGPLPMLPPAV